MRNSDRRDPTKLRFFYYLTQKIVTTLFYVLGGLKIEGSENIPKAGAFILASNHQSWFDPPIIGASCPREIIYAAKKDLFSLPLLGRLIRYYNSIPIRRKGSDKEALIKILGLLEEGFGAIIFPEGTRYRDGKLHPPKSGVGLLATKTGAPVVPVYINGSRHLLQQIFKRKLRVRFGKPLSNSELSPTEGNDKKNYHEFSWEVMRRIAEVGGLAPPMRQ